MNILVIKISAIGDVIMALPLVPAIKAMHPGANITWLVGDSAAPLLNCVAGIDRVVTVSEQHIFKGSLFQRIKAVLCLRKRLTDFYDMVLVGNYHPAYAMLGRITRHKTLRTFKKGRLPLPGRYHGCEYIRLFDQLSGPLENYPKFPILKDFNLTSGDELPTDRPLIALAPGGASNPLADDWQRRWPLSYFVELAQHISARGGMPVLLGGHAEKHLSAKFSGIKLYDFIGQTSLLEALGILKQCNCLISNDSGLMHLGLLASFPVVIGLFGPTAPSEKLPGGMGGIPVTCHPPLPCMPCYNGRGYLPCSTNICMKSLTVDRVMAFLDNLDILFAATSDRL